MIKFSILIFLQFRTQQVSPKDFKSTTNIRTHVFLDLYFWEFTAAENSTKIARI